ncbi:MAG: cation:proton antiporter [Bacillus sp. (in: firmicutes)]
MNSMLLVGIILLILFLIGATSVKTFNIPDIIIYILLGVVVSLTGWNMETEVIKQIGEMGLVLLFFMLGMKYSLKELNKNGKKIWKPGLLNIVLGIGATTVICYLLGLSFVSSLFVGGLVFATSSSIAVKFMEHHNILENKESKFILALLIFEDLVTPILITLLVGLTGEGLSIAKFSLLFIKIFGLAIIAFILTKTVKHYQEKIKLIIEEDVFIFLIIGMALAYGGLAIYLGLSEVIGGFLGGMMLADTEWKDKISKKIIPVRNLFLPFYFLYFGLSMEFTMHIPNFGLLIVILIWSVLYKIAVGYVGGQWYGVEKDLSLKAGMILTQRGEFSVIIAGLTAGALRIFSSMYVLLAALIGFLISHISVKYITAKKLQKDRMY